MGKWIPKACWSASLVESISFRLMKEAVSQKQGEEQSRKATDIDLWPLHAQIHVHMYPYCHVHIPTWMCTCATCKHNNNKKQTGRRAAGTCKVTQVFTAELEMDARWASPRPITPVPLRVFLLPRDLTFLKCVLFHLSNICKYIL